MGLGMQPWQRENNLNPLLSPVMKKGSGISEREAGDERELDVLEVSAP